MKIIVETDLGRDPDDFFALCYLFSAGADIRAITISPGDPDQISIAKFLVKQLGVDIPVGSANPSRNKTSSGGVHAKLLKKYGWPDRMKADGNGPDIISEEMKKNSCELFAIGPLQNVGSYLSRNPTHHFSRCTMQGGFVGYHLYSPNKKLRKFEDLEFCPTFNLSGDISGAEKLLNSSTPRSFVGKNVCHTIIYNRKIFENHKLIKPKCRAMELFMETMGLYLDKSGEKKFHDPTAAVCHLHPEIGTWFRGYLRRQKTGWGAVKGGNDKMLVDIDRTKLWEHIFNGF